MASPSALGLCRHRHLAANRDVYIVSRASLAADHASPGVDNVVAYSPVYHVVADPLADYVADHEVVYHVVDPEVVDHIADHKIFDRPADN